MFKQLILLFQVFGIFLYQLIFSGDITVNQKLPNNIQAGGEVTVEITVQKGDVTGFAKIQQIIPKGFDIEPIETNGATFSFKDNKMKFIWMSLPAEEEFIISYKLIADPTLSGDYTFGGQFSFISEGERKNIEIEKSTISINKSFEDTKPREKPVTSKNEKINIKCNRIISKIESGKTKVTVIVNKNGIEGFSRLTEQIPGGFIATEGNSSEGVFSFKKQTVKILWMAAPEGNTIEISYFISAQKNVSNGNYQLSGIFSYLDNEETKDYTLDEDTFNLNVKKSTEVKEPTKEIDKEETVVVDNNTVEIADITTTPYPETNVNYKIQIGAGHKTVSNNYFSKKYKLNEKVVVINHEGWIKYLTGNFTSYKDARDKRDAVKTKIKTAFVTAYNSGKRITVQEALMISNQKWYK